MSTGEGQEPIIIRKEDIIVPDKPEGARSQSCPRCGGVISTGTRFCNYCGEPVDQQAQAYMEATHPTPRAYPAQQGANTGWLIFLVICSALVLASPWIPWLIGYASYRGDSNWGFISGWEIANGVIHVYFVLAGGIIMLVCVLALLASWFTASPAGLKRGLSLGALAGAVTSLIAVLIAFIYITFKMGELTSFVESYYATLLLYHGPGMYVCLVFAILGIVASVVLAVQSRAGVYTPPVYGTH